MDSTFRNLNKLDYIYIYNVKYLTFQSNDGKLFDIA